MKYKRVLVKLSGEVLAGNLDFGIDQNMLLHYADEIEKVVQKGVQLALVIGGGNIFRGTELIENEIISKSKADQMGMLATCINAIALSEAFSGKGIRNKHLSAFHIGKMTEEFNNDHAIEYLESGYVLILSGGTGNPFFTTDSAAALRAAELKVDILLKGTKVDGVYSDDPAKNKYATRYTSLSFNETIQKNLKIMDTAAFAICKENKIPVIVYNTYEKGNLLKIIQGEENIGTIIS
ncbi:MAG TPA: UMP kinase [Bacteroidia bacterium]|nr:UMP kinase [Bacteroidia bacterium]HRS59336.1 UMP kinase [Bacteroidia bacterium]